MTDEAADKAARKAAKKAAKLAAAQSTEAAPEAIPDKQTKKRKADPGEAEAPIKKSKSSEDDQQAQDEVEKAAAKAAKKQRKAERKAAKALKESSGNVLETATNTETAAPVAQTTANASEVAAFLEENKITYEPAEAHSDYTPFLTFDQLPIDEGLRKGLSKFSKPTPIQSCSWSILLSGKDCVAIAETGSVTTYSRCHNTYLCRCCQVRQNYGFRRARH